jgi:hypothetical protein
MGKLKILFGENKETFSALSMTEMATKKTRKMCQKIPRKKYSKVFKKEQKIIKNFSLF